MLRRRAMMAASGSSRRLPAEYQEAEYLQSTGTQYIDTGVKPTSTMGFMLKVYREDTGNSFGAQYSSSKRFLFNEGGSVCSISYGGTKYSSTIPSTSALVTYLSTVDKCYVNGTEIGNAIPSVLPTTLNLYICGSNNNGTASLGKGKYYECQITDNGTLIRDFIPCYRKADGVAGMYDTVGNQFYTNQGTGEFIVGRPVDYLTMTVVIDETNSNPQTCCTYADDAIGMSSGSAAWDRFFGETPVLLNSSGTELGLLNPSNYAQYADGTSAPITTVGNDVMVKFPKMGVKIERVGTTLRVSITNDPNAESRGFKYYAHSYGANNNCNSIYVGAYKGYVTNSKLYSSSGKTPTASKTIVNFRTYAEARGTGYEQMTFYVRTFLTALYLIKYKNLDSQSAVGMGAVNTSLKATGNTNTKGLNYGSTSGTEQCKCLGIEDMWGNIYEFMDGIATDASYHILTAPTNSSLGTTSSYTDQGQGATSNLGNYAITAQGTTETGFLIKTDGGSESTYYCDFAQLLASCFGEVGGAWGATGGGGIFSASIRRAASYSSASAGSRLVKFNVA